tara:strand:- start:1186 stop:1938 length:753 start_codon:yes stop_codon:yes gene_type:complete
MCSTPNKDNTKPTVVITRTPSQGKELIKELIDSGFNVISRPTIEIALPDDQGASLSNAIQSLSDYEWVILTSSNGVTEFVKAVNKIGTKEFPKIAVIGSSTERALNNLGIRVSLRPNNQIAEGLLEVFPSPEVNNKVLLPVATNSRELLPRVLKEKGWNVDLVHSYKTIKPKHFQPYDNNKHNADYIVFTSPSTVVNFIEMYGQENLPKKLISIGPVTSEMIRKRNLSVYRESNPHDSTGILQCLRELLN